MSKPYKKKIKRVTVANHSIRKCDTCGALAEYRSYNWAFILCGFCKNEMIQTMVVNKWETKGWFFTHEVI